MEASAVFHVLQLVELVVDVLLVFLCGAICQHGGHQLVVVADALVIFIEEVKECVEIGTVFELGLGVLDLLAQALHLLRKAEQTAADGALQLINRRIVLLKLGVDALELGLHLAQIHLLNDGLLGGGTGTAAKVDAGEILCGVLEHRQNALTGALVGVVLAGLDAAVDDRSTHLQAGSKHRAKDSVCLGVMVGTAKPKSMLKQSSRLMIRFFM